MMPKGRPAISGSAKLGKLEIRHTAEERAILDAAAAVAGKPVSTWARDTLLDAAHMLTAKKPATRRK